MRWSRLIIGTCCLVAVMGSARQANAQTTITLMWDAVPDESVVGYIVHAGVQSRVYTQRFDVPGDLSFLYTNAVPGQLYCFAVSAYAEGPLEGPMSSEVCGYSNAPPQLTNPGALTSTAGVPVTLQLIGSDQYNEPLTYSATGLPPGLTLAPSTGFISGTPTAAGSFSVTATATDGLLSASRTFTWTIGLARPTLVSPTGTAGSTSPTYTWQAVVGATSYRLWVNDATTSQRINTVYTATQTGCAAGTGNCGITPAVTLASGTGTWWIQAISGSTLSPWSNAMQFTTPAAPPAPALVSPTGTINTNTPTFSWRSVTGATNYRLWVNDTSGAARIDTTYTAAQAGCASTCTITPGVALANGLVTFWVQAVNAIGPGAWSAGLSFTITPPQVPVPPAVTLVSPSGTTANNTPSFSWQAVAGVTGYRLWVNEFGRNARIDTTYTPTQAGCAAGTGTCTINPGVALAAGAGAWWIQATNNAGAGPWSAAMNFTVPSGPAPPGPATLVSPGGNLVTRTPSFTWLAMAGATGYRLWVNEFGRNARIDTTYTPTQAGCAAGTGTCTISPAVQLSAGVGAWWIQAINAVGPGAWSAAMAITVPASNVPLGVTLMSPAGPWSTNQPTFRWRAAAGATQYNLWVNDATTNARINVTFTATQAGCADPVANPVCTVTPGVTLAPGLATWWIRALSTGTQGPWSTPLTFTVQ